MDRQDLGVIGGGVGGGGQLKDIAACAIFMLDPEGKVATWNAGARRFGGYEASEVIGQSHARFFTPEDQAAGVPAAARRAALAEGRYEGEGWRVRKDGSRYWAHAVIEPVHTPSGTLIGFAIVTRDLSQRRAAAETLRRTEEQFRLLVQGVTDYAIYMIDPAGRVTNWNAGAERIKGYRAEEIIGDNFSRFYTAEDRAAGAPEVALRTARCEGRFEKEGWRVRKDGTRFWAHVVIDPIRDDDGELIGFAKITQDITERKDAQEALEQTRLALFQSQKLDAIGQLTGGVAHDFNNLLMAIIGSLELARKRLPDDPRITPLLDNAMLGAERGAALTQRMLAFARKQALELRAVDVGALVIGLTGLIERSLGPSYRFETHLPRDLPPALADANQLETAIVNLALNARDAMPEGGVIVIEARREAAGPDRAASPGGFVRIQVKDTGEGMDEATLARATEPFFTTKGIGKGTGLGLSMAHGIAEQSGGRLIIHSRPGEGTIVEIWLPQAREDKAPGAVSKVASADPTGQPLTVLAVDDDSLVLINAAFMLEDLGHRVLTAISASEALGILDRESVDLVVTDFAMPKVNGLQLVEKIAQKHPGLPVILATGFAELPAGVSAAAIRLSKPYLQSDLAAAISLAQFSVR
ncbi:MAG TPA: PAS domain S-box protein [Caulobacteraceae bacterium]|jgi:PAS domain S-box-containing protein|nr:PAS domain S-box protein [Caulobacteraceae bacterium]